nr:hypothetical protein [Bovine gammaherpesvirus 4]
MAFDLHLIGNNIYPLVEMDVTFNVMSFFDMTLEDLVFYLMYGINLWSKQVPTWVLSLHGSPSMSAFVLDRTMSRPGIPNRCAQKRFCMSVIQHLFMVCLVVILTLYPCGETITDVWPRLTKTMWSKYVDMSFYKAINSCLGYLKIKYKVPLVQCFVTSPLTIISKSRNKVSVTNTSPLSVPAPSLRPEIRDGNIDRLSGYDDAEIACVLALQQRAKTVPCGNPFYSMIKVLCYHSLIKTPYVVVPISGSDSLTRDIHVKIIAYNVLCCYISLPILSRGVLTSIGEKGTVQKFVTCLDCGHCLNFGRGKFKTINFLPTNIFYCRDQKEKQAVICATTGRIYCSYCGSSHITVLPMMGSDKKISYLRAVISNNAASAIKSIDQEVHVVVPCLGQNCGACIIKRLTINDLLYLTANPNNLTCFKCTR